jgi:hypothetical protein
MSDGYDAVVEVHVIALQGDYFAHSHARDGQQPDQRGVGSTFDWGLFTDLMCGLDQPLHVHRTVEIGGLPTILAWKQSLSWNLSPGVNRAQVYGKAAHNSQSVGFLHLLNMARLRRPSKRQFARNYRSALPLSKPHKTVE